MNVQTTNDPIECHTENGWKSWLEYGSDLNSDPNFMMQYRLYAFSALVL